MQKYPVLCAWCEKEGIETVVDHSLGEHSHGICQRHVEEVRAEAKRIARRFCDVIIEGDEALPGTVG